MRSVFLWGMAGVLGLAALTALSQPEAPVMTLEGGLGPTIQTSRL